MDTPTITMTMLGATGSGKTMFLHGMYATLSAGIAGYFVYTRDPDDDIDLMDTWDLLCEEGTLPPATDEQPVNHDFVFKYGLNPLLSIDCQDFRGGAALSSSRSGGPDVQQLRDRLAVSDTVYLVLDGGEVGRWIDTVVQAGGGAVNRSRDPMKVAALSRFIQDAADARRARGKLAPSIVVLITKSDLLPEITGMSKGKALRVTLENLKELVPVVYSEGITALVCPVQIGRLGQHKHEAVDPSAIDPVGLHKPFAFSLWHYLTEGIQDYAAELDQLRASKTAAAQEIASLRTRFAAGLFHRNRMRSLDDDLDSAERQLIEVAGREQGAQAMVSQLMEQLARLPIIKDGKLQV